MSLGPGKEFKSSNIKEIDVKEFNKMFKGSKKLIKHLEKNRHTTGTIIYNDLYNNFLFSTINGNGGNYTEVGETGYIKEL